MLPVQCLLIFPSIPCGIATVTSLAKVFTSGTGASYTLCILKAFSGNTSVIAWTIDVGHLEGSLTSFFYDIL